MTEFKPTWLYIKQHTITGLKYFGKTTRKDPVPYLGSGVRWRNHLRKYGENITTIWAQLFTDKDVLTEYAKKFSIDNNIVESIYWANLKIEDGLAGGHHNNFTNEGIEILREKGKKHKHTEGTKQKLREYRKKQLDPRLGKTHTEESKEKIRQKRSLQIITEESNIKRSEKMKGYLFSEERNQKISLANKGKPKSDEHREKLSLAAKARHQRENKNGKA